MLEDSFTYTYNIFALQAHNVLGIAIFLLLFSGVCIFLLLKGD